MAIDILDSLKSALGAPVTRQVSTVFGASEEATRSGLRSGMSALLAGVLHKSTMPGGAEEVYETVTSSSVDATLPSRVTSLLGNRGNLESSLATGHSMLSSIFGNRTSSVTEAISQVSGVKASSAAGLLAMAAPMLMGVLKKHVAQNNLDARGLGSVLLSQRESLQSAGLDNRIIGAMGFSNLRSVLGMGAAAEEPHVKTETWSPSEPRPAAAYSRTVPERPRARWVAWAVAGAIAIAILALLSSRFGNRERTPVAAATGTAAPAATSLPASVYFDVGRSDLTTSGQRTIQAVAGSVKAATAPVAVTGYADSSGNADQNAELAKNRASTVRDALVREGVAPANVVMSPPASTTPGAPANESRRVDIKLAEGPETGGAVR